MPPRTDPTARQARLGTELRKLREAAGMTARDAAKLLGSNPTQISHIESGRFGISEERLRTLAGHYSCDEIQLIDALVDIANDRYTGWWEEYRGRLPHQALDLASLEHHAASMHTIQITHIPGLFQTEDHVRAAAAYVRPDAQPSELEAHVSFRIRRKTAIERDGAPSFDVVLHEAALRIRVGGTKVTRAQLDRILGMAERENVTVRVIPFAVEDFAGAGHSMLYLNGPVPQLDTVHMDTPHTTILVDAALQLRRHWTRMERVGRSALSAGASRDFIHRMAREL